MHPLHPPGPNPNPATPRRRAGTAQPCRSFQLACVHFPLPYHLSVPLLTSSWVFAYPHAAEYDPLALICTGFNRLQGQYLLWERVKHLFSNLFRERLSNTSALIM